MPIRILIADDHAIFRCGLRSFLEKQEDFEIVGESGDGFETIKFVTENEVDILLLDISMPGPPAAKVAQEILKNKPHIAIVVLTMHEDEYYLQEFLKIGVHAFVLKKSTATELVTAIRAAFEGKHYVDPALSDYVVSSYVGRPATKKSGGISLLSQREREVLRLLALGFTNEEVAKDLFISKRTVESHRANIMEKLGLKSRAELVRFAIENELLRA